MRLINCEINNVKVHSSLSIEFDPNLTIISGGNETGKSTLVEALHKTLFLKASSTGNIVENLRSKSVLDHPKIAIRFSAKGHTYIVKKCFSGSSGQTTLVNENTGDEFRDHTAEDFLSELLGFKEMLGSRQAGKLLPTRWAHLWVSQGASSHDLISKGKTFYDFDNLILQLQKKGGAAIQLSKHDQKVLKAIDSSIEENLTTRGVKKNSELWKLIQKVEQAEIEVSIANDKCKEYEQSNEELTKITEEINIITTKDLNKLTKGKKILAENKEELNKVKNNISIAQKELEPIQLRLDSMQKALNEYVQLENNIIMKEEEQVKLNIKISESKAAEVLICNELQITKELYKKDKERMKIIDQRREIIQILAEQSRKKEQNEIIIKSLEKHKESKAKSESIQNRLKQLSLITSGGLAKLKALSLEIRDLKIKRESFASKVKLIKGKKDVRVNDKLINEGQEYLQSKNIRIQVGDDVLIEINPGGLDEKYDIEKEYDQSKKKFSELIKELGVKSISDAEMDLQEKNILEQTLKSIVLLDIDEFKSKETQKEKNTAKVNELSYKLSEMDIDPSNIMTLENRIFNPDDLFSLQERTKKSFLKLSLKISEAEVKLKNHNITINSQKSLIQSQSNKIHVIKNELNDRKQRLNNIKKEYGTKELVDSQIQKIKSNVREIEIKKNTLDKVLAELNREISLNQYENIDEQIESLKSKKDYLIAKRGAAKQRCDLISENDPYSRLELAINHLRTAQQEYISKKQLLDSHLLLKKLFNESQKDLSNKYTMPLIKSIHENIQPLIPDKEILVKMNFDQDRGFNSLQLKKGNELYDFNELSGGMKEQFSAALRISMAEILKESNDGCLPIIFDDAFCNSDPERTPIINDMLEKAANRGLQIIILTCNPNSYIYSKKSKILLD